MISQFIETWEFIQAVGLPGLLAMLGLAIAAPLLGVFLVIRRMPLLGLALPEMAATGQAFALLLLGTSMSGGTSGERTLEAVLQHAGSALFVLLGLAAIFASGRVPSFVGLAAGIAFLVARSLREVFLLHTPHSHGSERLLPHGRILTVTEDGSTVVIAASLFAAVMAIALFRRLWISAFDPDQARLLHFSPGAAMFMTLALCGILSSFCAPVVGPEGVFALLLIPPAVLRSAAPSFRSFAPLAILAGLAGVAAAFFLAYSEAIDWPVEPALVLSVLLTSGLLWLALRLRRAWRLRQIP